MPEQFLITIPQTVGEARQVTVHVGEVAFVLGANGTGKSSLLHHIYSAHYGNTRRISAHRQTWFASDTIDLSPSARRNTEQNINASDTNPQSRYKDDYSAHRSMITIYDLVDAENVRARAIAGKVDEKDLQGAEKLSAQEAPIKIINELLRLSNIPISLTIHANEQVLASKDGSEPYSIAQLSDGERNALLIAANVLTAPAGTLLIIDEPERHLHRSIISPLLTSLFAKRADCAFVVSTHDVLLPLDNPAAQTLLIRSCVYAGQQVQSWDTDLIPAKEDIDETSKRDILGARRKIIFVEGEDKSLDQALYSLTFPKTSVVPKTNCREVMQSVYGIREASELHWLHAWGIIDKDQRSDEESAELTTRGIFAVPFYSVESIYYHPEIIRRMAVRQSHVLEANAESLYADALSAAMKAVAPHRARLTVKIAEKAVREQVFQCLPRAGDIEKRQPINVTIDVDAIRTAEEARFDQAIASGNFIDLITRYPLRETPALHEIATKLDFRNRSKYEGAVRKMLIDDADALKFVRELFGSLVSEIEST